MAPFVENIPDCITVFPHALDKEKLKLRDSALFNAIQSKLKTVQLNLVKSKPKQLFVDF